MTRPRTADVRKAIPDRVKVIVLERELLKARGEEGPIQYDHNPALGLRDWKDAAGDYEPPQLDPGYINAHGKAAHRAKTTGRKGEKRSTSYGSDAHAIAKTKRLIRARGMPLVEQGFDADKPIDFDEMDRRLRVGPERPQRKRRIPSRPFPKQARKLRSRNSFQRKRT